MRKKKKKMTWFWLVTLVVSIVGVVVVSASYRRDDAVTHNLDDLIEKMRKEHPPKD